METLQPYKKEVDTTVEEADATPLTIEELEKMTLAEVLDDRTSLERILGKMVTEDPNPTSIQGQRD